VEEKTTVASYEAIIPSIAGWARATGTNTITIDTRDPFAYGFVVR
ncbi:MAG: proline racemase family protein, partial [Roseibium sp.]